MVSYIITFLAGTYLGIVFMCLLQINRQFNGGSPSISRMLARRINELCKEKGVTYEELSYKSEIPFDNISDMLDGLERNFSVFAIAKICKGLDVSLRYFFDTEEFRNMYKYR